MGVHDVFHASLLREHIPNDDQLFPGQMDTQVWNTPDTEGKWAVERLLLHSGSGANSLFEVKWASGDITWLPYYQITHLQALSKYLDLVGVQKINLLIKGSRTPPQNDPQIYVRAITKIATSPDPPVLKNQHKNLPNNHHPHFSFPSTNSSPTSTRTHTRPKPDLSYIMPAIRNSYLCSINHPSFTCVSPTTYLVKQQDYPILLSIHVTQITKYIQFDKKIYEDDDASHYQSVSISFYDFCNAWNSGVAPDDPHHLSTFYYAEETAHNTISPSPYPVQLHRFYITPAQAGATHSSSNQMSNSLQSDINQEFAAIMVAKQKKEHQSFEEHEQKHTSIFEKNKPSYYPPS